MTDFFSLEDLQKKRVQIYFPGDRDAGGDGGGVGGGGAGGGGDDGGGMDGGEDGEIGGGTGTQLHFAILTTLLLQASGEPTFR